MDNNTQPLVIYSAIMAGICFVSLIIWIAFACSTAHKEHKAFFVSLTLMIIATTGLHASDTVQYADPLVPLTYTRLAASLCDQLYEASYLVFTWNRAKSIIQFDYPRTWKFVDILIKFTVGLVCLQLVQVILVFILELTQPESIASIAYLAYIGTALISVCFTFTVDVTILINFIKFLRRNKVEATIGATNDSHLQIVATYMSYTTVLSFSSVAAIIAYAFTGSDIALKVEYFFLDSIFWGLFAMKVELTREEKARVSRLHTKLEAALGKTELESIHRASEVRRNTLIIGKLDSTKSNQMRSSCTDDKQKSNRLSFIHEGHGSLGRRVRD